MSNTIQYKVLRKRLCEFNDANLFGEEVTNHLNNGWKIHGPLITTANKDIQIYSQAIVKGIPREELSRFQ